MMRIRRSLTLLKQVGRLKSKYKGFLVTVIRGKLHVFGSIRPTSRSGDYKFRIQYRLNNSPKIWIVSPQLKRNWKGEKIPHMYGQKYLCLYQPRYDEFNSQSFISDTIIPWISLWLYYYEIWHMTGRWLGGGEHPKTRKNK